MVWQNRAKGRCNTDVCLAVLILFRLDTTEEQNFCKTEVMWVCIQKLNFNL